MSKIGNKIYFSDFFEVEHSTIEDYGALDVSLICDNPAFVDPFLIFSNEKYKDLHNFIIKYLLFLRDQSEREDMTTGIREHYYKFPEVKEAWLGYSVKGNSGSGLGRGFANSLHINLSSIFRKFDEKNITKSFHLEKLCLIEEGVGVDKISDLTINLIKFFLLEYTQEFAKRHIDSKYLDEFSVPKVVFDFEKKQWEGGRFTLPKINIDGEEQFVLLTPIDILTKEKTWISRNDFLTKNNKIFETISNSEQRHKINQYFKDNLLKKYNNETREYEEDRSLKSKKEAFRKTFLQYPEIVDYYIKSKEDFDSNDLESHKINPNEVNFFEDVSVIRKELEEIQRQGKPYSLDDCILRIEYFKNVIESNSNSLYIFKGEHLKEKHLQIMFKMTHFGSHVDYNSEVNNGRGSVDFIASYGSNDKVGIELKLASNSRLEQGLSIQTEIYKKDSKLNHVIKIIFYFSDEELDKVNRILKGIPETEDETRFLIDCRRKKSASVQN